MKNILFYLMISAIFLLSGCANNEPAEVEISSDTYVCTQPVIRPNYQSGSFVGSDNGISEVISETADRLVLVGDSRTLQLGYYIFEMTVVDNYLVDETTSDGDSVLGVGGDGYNWLKDHTAEIEAKLTDGCALVVNMGVNGAPYFHSEIAEWCNKEAKKYKDKGVKVYFMSVNPVNDTLMAEYDYIIRNADVISFNNAIKKELVGVTYLDTYSFIKDDILGEGNGTVDGLHYYPSVYNKIKDYTWKTVKGK